MGKPIFTDYTRVIEFANEDRLYGVIYSYLINEQGGIKTCFIYSYRSVHRAYFKTIEECKTWLMNCYIQVFECGQNTLDYIDESYLKSDNERYKR